MKGKKVWIVVGVVFSVGAVLFIAPARAIDMTEGKWEHTMEMKMEGMPGVPAMPFTNTQCMTQKDLVPKTPRRMRTVRSLNKRLRAIR